LEKLAVISLTNAKFKLHNPRCPRCGKTMKSMGMGKGFRCRGRHCQSHQRLAPEAAEYSSPTRPLTPGLYEVPIVARRHISKPLKRVKYPAGTMGLPTEKFINQLKFCTSQYI
jgi:tRNA(Ile2)-agmatinylcytidine synthase